MAQPESTSPIVLHYCHDTFGLGHISRTRTLARQLRLTRPDVSQVIVTGSPVAEELLGAGDDEGIDYIKLPSVVKLGAGHYAARSIAAPFAAVRDTRAAILESAARHLRPDLFVVDHAPAGLAGEALPALRHLARHQPGTQLILGLRDIVDTPAEVRRVWAETGVYELLDEVYDRILVYGQADVFDVARAYHLSDRAARKLCYVGYLGHRPGDPVVRSHVADPVVHAADHLAEGLPDSPAQSRPVASRAAPRPAGRQVLVTAGGGGDGFPLVSAMLAARAEGTAAPDYDCRIVLGPLMPRSERSELRARAGGLHGVELVDFDPQLARTLADADGVVAMGGYNTVCEILAQRRPALIVPRVRPREEQLIRARILNRRGLVRMLHPDRLSPDRLNAAVGDLLDHPNRPHMPVDLDGVQATARVLDGLLGEVASGGAPRRVCGG